MSLATIYRPKSYSSVTSWLNKLCMAFGARELPAWQEYLRKVRRKPQVGRTIWVIMNINNILRYLGSFLEKIGLLYIPCVNLWFTQCWYQLIKNENCDSQHVLKCIQFPYSRLGVWDLSKVNLMWAEGQISCELGQNFTIPKNLSTSHWQQRCFFQVPCKQYEKHINKYA